MRDINRTTGRLNNGIPQIPPLRGVSNINIRETLPIYKHQHEILKSISNYQVVLISGDTGSGKTTQVTIYKHNYFLFI